MKFLKTTLILGLCLFSAQSVMAQDSKKKPLSDRQREVKRLKAMLKDVDAALKALKPIVLPKLTTEYYDLRQLFYRPQDRAAPSLAIKADSSGMRTSNGGSLSFDDGEEDMKGVLYEPDQMVETIYNLTGENQWQSPRSIEIYRGTLIVRNTAVVHARIRRFLKDVRENALRSIQMEVGFYQLDTKVKKSIEDAAAKGKGLLDSKALKLLDKSISGKSGKLVGHAVLTALNEQRVYLHQGAESTYVSTFERSSGGTGAVVKAVADPIVEVLRSGMALDMRGTVMNRSNKKSVALEVRFVRAKLLKFVTRNTPWGGIDTPKVKLDSVRTAALIPPGAGMLVFSSKASDQEKKAAGVEKTVPQDVVIVVRPRLVTDSKKN